MSKLSADFYKRDNVQLISRELLGKVLCTNFHGKLTSGIIVETEAYVLTDKEGWKSIEYTHLVPVLIEAIKEQQILISEQESQMQQMQYSLEAELKVLKEGLLNLESHLMTTEK